MEAIFDLDRNFFAIPMPHTFHPRSAQKWNSEEAIFMASTGLTPKGVFQFKLLLTEQYKTENLLGQEAKAYFATPDGRILMNFTKEDFRRLTFYCEDEPTRELIYALTDNVRPSLYAPLIKEYLKFQVSQLRGLLDTEGFVSIAFDNNLMSIFVMLQLPSGSGRVVAFKGTGGNLELVFFQVSEMHNVLEGISLWSRMHLPPGECSRPGCESRFPQLKCRRCGVRYCQKECQAAHWNAHKEVCTEQKAAVDSGVAARCVGAADMQDVEAAMAALHVSHPCVVCGAEGRLHCCNSTWYCSKPCQAQAWKQHKKACLRRQAKEPKEDGAAGA
jgi:hypothetical protein